MTLTDQQIHVLHLVAFGLDNADVARLLRVCPATAKNYTSQMLTALDAPNRAAAVAIGAATGLLDLGRVRSEFHLGEAAR